MRSNEASLIRAQGEAFRLNKRFAVRKPGALELEDAAMALNVLVIPYGIKGASARLIRNGNKGRIRLNPNLKVEGARRFAVAHELGHWLMHQTESQLFSCTAENLRDYYASPLEAEANHFASELLIPTPLFRPMMNSAEPDLTLIGQWSQLFRSSLTATTLRFIRDSKHDCIAVSIKDGKIAWWWGKENGRRIWLKNGTPIKPGSLAWELNEGKSTFGKMEMVDPSAWLSHLPFEFTGELHEDSLLMPKFNSIFTLLWIIN